ncbi:septum formation family protein [Streptomyces sp. CNQ085]|uniref:septum formation family protein n=1 Tax=Streptomyces sp. CNQ085 TaxID=2886944 RepID=UPI001F507826|nr:septum formation family protein [Streptomyces sp. CNQ085]MCI0382887.1 septum formation family protein [Streptomyces sp. CNQ085]
MTTCASFRSRRGISAAVALLAIGAAGCSDIVDSAENGATKVARQRSVFSLSTGDCYNPNSEKTEGEALAVELVPCDEPHRGQVVGEFDIEEKGEFPGDEAVTSVADERCPAEAGEFAPDAWALPEGVGLSYYTPTAESWATGDRAVSCTYTKESGEFTGSLKAGAKSLKPGQKTYLDGANAVYDALWANQPTAESVEEDLEGYKAQADAVATALDAHLDGLRGMEGTETGRLRARLEKAAGHWRGAAKAGDADAFYTSYDPAFTGLDPSGTVAARKELGLATTVPAEDAEVWAS